MRKIGEKRVRSRLSKRSQVTIFIIIAIVIVAAIFIIFSAKVRTSITGIFVPANPFVKLQDCLNEKISGGINQVSLRGGSFQPVNGISYMDNKVEYLCYTNEYYQTCVMQQPLLKQHVERELLTYIKPEAERCFSEAIDNLRSKGYKVSEGKRDIAIELVKDNIIVSSPGINVRNENEGKNYGTLEARYKTNLYNFVMVSGSILNWEARYGDTEIMNYMAYYPDLKIEKLTQGDGSKIYVITNIIDEDKFVFATRSLAWPSGLGVGQISKPVTV